MKFVEILNSSYNEYQNDEDTSHKKTSLGKLFEKEEILKSNI